MYIYIYVFIHIYIHIIADIAASFSSSNKLIRFNKLYIYIYTRYLIPPHEQGSSKTNNFKQCQSNYGVSINRNHLRNICCLFQNPQKMGSHFHDPLFKPQWVPDFFPPVWASQYVWLPLPQPLVRPGRR